MNRKNTTRNRQIYILGTISILLVLAFISLLAFRLITGRSLGLRSFISTRIQNVTNLPRSVLDSSNIQAHSQGEFNNIVFLHHSVGNNLIEQGEVREGLLEAGYDFWDHNLSLIHI